MLKGKGHGQIYADGMQADTVWHLVGLWAIVCGATPFSFVSATSCYDFSH